LGQNIPPNHRLVVPNINRKSPLSWARNPQEKGVSHCPLTTQISHNPLVFSYNYLEFPPALFLLTCPTQGMYPFTTLSPLCIPFIYQVSLAQVTRNLTIGNSRELTARKNTRKTTTILLLQCNSHMSSLFRLDNLVLLFSSKMLFSIYLHSIIHQPSCLAPILFFPVLFFLFMQKHAFVKLVVLAI
jgi:hypothetical protein